MYAIAYYTNPTSNYVSAVGTNTRIVISTLKTTRGIIARAKAQELTRGKGTLFGLELWRNRENIYKPADLTFMAENGRMPLQGLPLSLLIDHHNQTNPDFIQLRAA